MGEIEGEATTWLDKMHVICDKLDNMSAFCGKKAFVFREVGMDKLASDMQLMSETLEYEAKHLRVLISEKVTEQLKDTNENSAAVFKAMLAGMRLR